MACVGLSTGFAKLAGAENPPVTVIRGPAADRRDLRKGICYGNDSFPNPYNPSIANQTEVFFGSDNAADYIKPLWGGQFTPQPDPSASGGCGGDGQVPCRDDLKKMQAMGVQVVKLYDWDPRNRHRGFLDECQKLGIGVLFSVSDYFIKPGGGLGQKDVLIPQLIQSISVPDSFGSDYHPAIVGLAMGNEFDGFNEQNLAEFTNAWVRHESTQHNKRMKIGHPLAFAADNGKLPCWDRLDKLLPLLNANVKIRLFLAPNSYNDAKYLFEDVGGPKAGRGWVDLTSEKYDLPIWFTEIGQNRRAQNYSDIVRGQLKACLSYSRAHPNKLIGACFFAFLDKVWVPGTTEGSFGAHSHGSCSGTGGQCAIHYSAKDFTHWEVPAGQLRLETLQRTPLYDVVSNVYLTEP